MPAPSPDGWRAAVSGDDPVRHPAWMRAVALVCLLAAVALVFAAIV